MMIQSFQTSKLNKTILEEEEEPKQDRDSETKAGSDDVITDPSCTSDHNGNEKKVFGTKRKVPMLRSGEKKGSAIDLDIGPPLDSTQTKNYRTIQQILIRYLTVLVKLVYGSRWSFTFNALTHLDDFQNEQAVRAAQHKLDELDHVLTEWIHVSFWIRARIESGLVITSYQFCGTRGGDWLWQCFF